MHIGRVPVKCATEALDTMAAWNASRLLQRILILQWPVSISPGDLGSSRTSADLIG